MIYLSTFSDYHIDIASASTSRPGHDWKWIHSHRSRSEGKNDQNTHSKQKKQKSANLPSSSKWTTIFGEMQEGSFWYVTWGEREFTGLKIATSAVAKVTNVLGLWPKKFMFVAKLQLVHFVKYGKHFKKHNLVQS